MKNLPPLFDALRSLPSALYLIALYIFIFAPVAVLVVFSFQESSIPAPPFDGPSLKWYQQVFGDRRLMGALQNSVVVAVASATVAVVLGFLAAYGMARHRPYGARALQWLFTAPLMVSYLVIGMGLLITFQTLGIPKSLLAVIIGHVVINLPLCFAVLYSQMGAHHENIERAARDLGAREWQVILLVSAPALWPALLGAFLLSITLSWDEFIIALLVSRFEVTLPVEIWSMLRSGISPRANAIGSLVFLISFVVVLAFDFVVFRRRRT